MRLVGGIMMKAVNDMQETLVEKTRVSMEDPAAAGKIAADLVRRMLRYGVTDDMTKVLLCIGTDRSTGDCLGPLVGSKLDLLQQDFFIVCGTLDKPVHASNLKEILDMIHKQNSNPFIVAIDACLGRLESVGYVQLGDGSLLPGAGVNKNLPPVGQIHITGVVNVGGYMEYMILQNTRLNLVMRLADVIADGIKQAILAFEKKNTGEL